MFGARDLRAVLAGAFLCGVVADGVAAAQEGAEITEDLGGSYVLARRTTSQGSIIETLLYAGRAIVTDIVVPTLGGAGSIEATGAVPRTDAGRTGAVATSFGGVLLSAEMSDGYLILHRMRAEGPVTHDVFRDGEKVGVVSEVRGAGAARGRTVFAFETAGERFIVHMTQPDGTKIRATSERGQMSEQTIEQGAAARPSAIAVTTTPPSRTPPSLTRPTPASRLPVPESIVARETAESVPLPPAPKPASSRAAPVHPQVRARPQAPGAAAVSGFYSGTPAQPAARGVVPGTAAATARSRLPADTVNARSAAVATARPARASSPTVAGTQRRANKGQP